MPLSKFSALREGTLNRFYTRHSVGEVLIEQLAHLNPVSVVDLGAGNGSLSISSAKCWPLAEFLTVDMDPECVSPLHDNMLAAGAVQHRHVTLDVFDYKLPAKVGIASAVDLAICNPPFFRPEWRREFAQILQAADLADACPSTSDISAELLFLAQNLRLVKDGGTVAMIVPDGLVTGWRSKPLRRALLARYTVESVMQLPPHSFHDTEARCFVLFLVKKERSTETVKLLRYETGIGLNAPLLIRIADAEQRMDYDYHAAGRNDGGRITTLRQLGADVRRGSMSTVQARTASFPVFHTSDYSKLLEGEIRLDTMAAASSRKEVVTAVPGDILMARVDRKLHEKVAIVISGEAAITDCVYRVRLPLAVQRSVFNALKSADGSAKLMALSKGVSARLLGKADLLDMPISI